MSLNKNGIIGTVVVHGAVIIIILLLGFSTQLPLPAEQGILINFGNSNTGRGRVEPRQSEKRQVEQPEEISTPSQPVAKTEVKEKVLTQDVEEAPAIKNPEPKKTTPANKENPTPVEKKPEVKEKPVEKPREVNKRALYGGQNKSGTSDASEGVSGNDGNQGSPTGSPDSPDHSLGLSSGNGISFSLEGRNPMMLQKPEFDYQKEGKVVVEITVDKQGNVVNANPGVKGSTTLDSYLLAAAKKAALKSKFDRSSNSPAYQKGTITYFFKLQ
jgi:TonB family protein